MSEARLSPWQVKKPRLESEYLAQDIQQNSGAPSPDHHPAPKEGTCSDGLGPFAGRSRGDSPEALPLQARGSSRRRKCWRRRQEARESPSSESSAHPGAAGLDGRPSCRRGSLSVLSCFAWRQGSKLASLSGAFSCKPPGAHYADFFEETFFFPCNKASEVEVNSVTQQ